MDDLERAEIRKQNAFTEMERAKWLMKETDRARFKFAFDSEERKTAQYLYEEACQEHRAKVAYFHAVTKEYDDTRMRATAAQK